MNYSELTEVKPYPAYKTSQIPWIGEIPEHWEVSHLRYFCECLDGRRIPLSAENRGDKQGNIPYWGANSVIDHINGWIFDEPLVLVGEDGAPFTDTTRSVAFFVNEKVWVNNHIHVLRCSKELRPEFLVHILNSVDYKDFISGSTRDKLTQQRLLDIPIQLAPPTEQAAIVRFLDHADEQIKRYIASKERLIALLEEERQALVHQAVTRGLDPNVKLKSSGVEWLGDVPEHWELRRIRNLGQAIIGLTYSPQDIVNKDEGKLVLRASNISGGGIVDADNVYVRSPVPDKLVLREGDILICSRSGSRNLIGKNARIESTMLGATFGAFMTILRGRNNDYLHQVFNSKLFEYQSGAFLTSTINQLTLGILNDMKIPFPPAGEQRSILQHLKQATKTVDVTIDRSRRQTALMKEYRTRLIADVVTGQLDVREAAEELPTPEPTEITD